MSVSLTLIAGDGTEWVPTSITVAGSLTARDVISIVRDSFPGRGQPILFDALSCTRLSEVAPVQFTAAARIVAPWLDDGDLSCSSRFAAVVLSGRGDAGSDVRRRLETLRLVFQCLHSNAVKQASRLAAEIARTETILKKADEEGHRLVVELPNILSRLHEIRVPFHPDRSVADVLQVQDGLDVRWGEQLCANMEDMSATRAEAESSLEVFRSRVDEFQAQVDEARTSTVANTSTVARIVALLDAFRLYSSEFLQTWSLLLAKLEEIRHRAPPRELRRLQRCESLVGDALDEVVPLIEKRAVLGSAAKIVLEPLDMECLRINDEFRKWQTKYAQIEEEMSFLVPGCCERPSEAIHCKDRSLQQWLRLLPSHVVTTGAEELADQVLQHVAGFRLMRVVPHDANDAADSQTNSHQDRLDAAEMKYQEAVQRQQVELKRLADAQEDLHRQLREANEQISAFRTQLVRKDDEISSVRAVAEQQRMDYEAAMVHVKETQSDLAAVQRQREDEATLNAHLTSKLTEMQQLMSYLQQSELGHTGGAAAPRPIGSKTDRNSSDGNVQDVLAYLDTHLRAAWPKPSRSDDWLLRADSPAALSGKHLTVCADPNDTSAAEICLSIQFRHLVDADSAGQPQVVGFDAASPRTFIVDGNTAAAVSRELVEKVLSFKYSTHTKCFKARYKFPKAFDVVSLRNKSVEVILDPQCEVLQSRQGGDDSVELKIVSATTSFQLTATVLASREVPV